MMQPLFKSSFKIVKGININNISRILKDATYYYSTDPCGMPNHQSWGATGDSFSCDGTGTGSSGLILGAYYDEKDYLTQTICLTKAAALFNHNHNGRLVESLASYGPMPKFGEVRTFTNLDPAFSVITVIGLGDNNTGYVKRELRDEGRENIRKAVGIACNILQKSNVEKIYLESFEDAESASEGAALALYAYQNLRSESRRMISTPDILVYGDCDMKKWKIGLEKAEAQNFARTMMETPSNVMVPRTFAYSVVKSLCKTTINVNLRAESWLKEHNMNAFLTNTRGSPQPAFLLEMEYNGCDPAIPPIVLIGKGMTFNSGGLCIKNCGDMKHMRGDMMGGAAVVAAFRAAANLGLPVNLRGLIPLGENMPGGKAAHPRDIVKSASGKSILVSGQDFDGNLLMADTLCYAQKYKPKYIISMSTMSKEIKTSYHLRGQSVFTSNEKLWQLLKTASVYSGDRMIKTPLWQVFEREVIDFEAADLSTLVKFWRGLPCSNTGFLKQFTCRENWAHIDMMGTLYEDGATPYLRKGMSGRPTRTLVEFLGQLAYPPSDIQHSDKEETEREESD